MKSTAFADQDWPGKEQEKKPQPKQQKDDGASDQKPPEMTPMQQYFLDRLQEEMQTMRSFQNNDGRPEGDLKLLDTDALDQLESGVSVEDQYVSSFPLRRVLTQYMR